MTNNTQYFFFNWRGTATKKNLNTMKWPVDKNKFGDLKNIFAAISGKIRFLLKT